MDFWTIVWAFFVAQMLWNVSGLILGVILSMLGAILK